MGLVAVAWPVLESDVAMATSLLEAEGIPYFVQGSGIASVLPGVQIGGYNTRILRVPEEHAERAREVLALLDAHDAADGEPPAPRGTSRLRVILETLLFGWFVPDARRRSARHVPGDD